MNEPELIPVLKEEREPFMEMAVPYFQEAIPGFKPDSDFLKYFFDGVCKPNHFARWVVHNEERIGFVIFGIEDHRFLPRKTGFFYAMYIVPEHRGGGRATWVMQECCRILDTFHPSKIELEIIEGNEAAERVWSRIGFRRVSSKYYLLERNF